MYQDDSFFTLGVWGQIGLAGLSAALFCVMLLLVRRIGRGRPRAARTAIALVLFWAFEWLSPQVYYLYYWMIIDGLPVQSVIGPPPGPAHIARLLTFSESHSLSAHGRGLLGWAMLAAALLRLPHRSELTGSHNSE